MREWFLVFKQIKLIFTGKVWHLVSFWKWEFYTAPQYNVPLLSKNNSLSPITPLHLFLNSFWHEAPVKRYAFFMVKHEKSDDIAWNGWLESLYYDTLELYVFL